ncbi:MAG: T9SS type A sorting domain-containing protein [Saprospiraceae bacterium]|nr:T9SS type A sorting domain-containing protein [Saprospiraceae bacterium]
MYNSCNNGAMVATANSDNDGFYTFNVTNGEYSVKVDANDPISSNFGSYSCCFLINNASQNEVCNFGDDLPTCTPNPYSVDNLCEDAFNNPTFRLPFISDFACSQNPSFIGPWNGQLHCSGVYSNTTFFGFIAGSGNYNLDITVFDCAGKGLQYGIMDSCNPGGPYNICNGNANKGYITIDCSNLIPCKKYIFWINGYEGAVCSFYTNVTGDFTICDPTPVEIEPLDVDINLSLACDSSCNQNFGKILSVVSKDSLPKIEEYNWLISNATTTINQTTSTPKIDISSLSSGEYNVCIQIDSAITHAETRYCKRITIEDDYSIVKNTFTLCETELPWFGASDTYGNKLLDVFGTHWRWDQGPIIWSDLQIGKNTFINERKDKCGCSYQQEITVIYHVRGQACDDNDDTTIDDIVLDDCTCKGTNTSGITSNTTWYYRPYTSNQNTDVWLVKALRDTLINSQIYKIVGLNRGNGIIKQTEIPVALVGGHMYFFENGERKLLYDFNAKVDDIVTYYVPKIQRFYDISSNGGFTAGQDKEYKLKVDKIDTLVTSEGKILKRFKNSATERNEEFHFFNDIIEGVGGSLGLFGAFGPFLSSGTEGSIGCFQNEEGFYSILGDDCKLVNTNNILNDSPYALFPNPSRSQITISGNNMSIASFQCRDLGGKTIHLPYGLSTGDLVFDIQHLPLGIYFILLKIDEKTYPMKFVKVD